MSEHTALVQAAMDGERFKVLVANAYLILQECGGSFGYDAVAISTWFDDEVKPWLVEAALALDLVPELTASKRRAPND